MRLGPALAIPLFLAAACGSANVTLDATQAAPGKALTAGEKLAVTPLPGTATEIVTCIEDALAGELEDGTLMTAAAFRSAMAPVLPGPTGTWPEYKAKLAEPETTAHAEALGLRYVVAISGNAYDTDSTWGECGGGGGGAFCIGGMGQKRNVQLTARLLDIRDGAAEAERISVRGRGRNEVGMILIVPYVWVTRTEAKVCNALAEQIARFASGKPVEETVDTGG